MASPGRVNDMDFSCSGHLKYFPEHRVLLVTHFYLLIKGETVVGAFDTEIDAYLDSVAKYGLGSFPIQKCTPGKEAYTRTFHSRVVFA
jgi:hypothetical protein